jgi:hypothetical protein
VCPHAYSLGAYTPHDQATAGAPDRVAADPHVAGAPLAALLDQLLAALDNG